MNSMNDGLLYADKPTHGRARLSRALLTLAIPPLACGFVIGLSWGSIGGVFVMPGFKSRYALSDTEQGTASSRRRFCRTDSVRR